MHDEPKIETLPDKHYAGIRKQVTMAEMGPVLPPLHREVRDWLASKGIQPSGAPVWVYRVIDMDNKLEIDVGWIIAEPVQGDDRVVVGVLPAGRYVTMLYTGDYRGDGLMHATGDLLNWGEAQGLKFDQWPSGTAGEGWKARTEFYQKDDNSDPATWETRLEFRLADQ